MSLVQMHVRLHLTLMALGFVKVVYSVVVFFFVSMCVNHYTVMPN